MNPADPQEIEVKLIIACDHPDKIADQIWALNNITGFMLSNPDALKIRDIYFDTPQGNLAKLRLAMRLRFTGADCLITIKGKTQKNNWGGVKRLEIEKPCSLASLQYICGKLEEHGAKLGDDHITYDNSQPIESVRHLGFQVIQDRHTFRRKKLLTSSGDPGKILAEISIDKVTYKCMEQSVIHHEIEIEAKEDGGITAVRTVSEELRKEFPQDLRTVSFSKLTLGILLKKFSEKTDFQKYMDKQGQLLPAAYDLIAAQANQISE